VLFEPEPTQFDLRWRMLGTDVRVHPWFWIMSALLGWNLADRNLGYLALWIVCVFVSILIHEFGHVLMGRCFGMPGYIVLYSFGGLAVGSNRLPRHWQRILVSLAGPAAGFLLFGLIWVLFRFVLDRSMLTENLIITYLFLKWINLAWGFLNLLPIWPLDGGQVSRDLLDWWLWRRGVCIALGISIIVAGLLAANALYLATGHKLPEPLDSIPFISGMGGMWNALLFGSLAFNSFQALQVELQHKPWEREDDYWQR